ncbi:MAG: MerR family transcriptional regulator [Mycobacteriaceae bacterium]
MRISELARRGGVPVGTVKYYLREGLLPPGEATSATQASYDEGHVERLTLVRALLGPGGLSIARAREVLAAVDDPSISVHDALGAACAATSEPSPQTTDLAAAMAHVGRWGWWVTEDSPALQDLARALAAAQEVDLDVTEAHLDAYAEAAARVGRADVAAVPTSSQADAVRYVVLGTVLMDPVLLALRRLAQEDASGRRFGAQDLSGLMVPLAADRTAAGT